MILLVEDAMHNDLDNKMILFAANFIKGCSVYKRKVQEILLELSETRSKLNIDRQ